MAAMEQSLIEQYKDVYVFAQQVDNAVSYTHLRAHET